MENLSINLLKQKHNASNQNKTGTSPVKFFISPLAIAIIFIVSFLLGRVSQSEAASIALAGLDTLPLVSRMSHLIGSQDRLLIGEKEDRINFLLIGIGGEGHDGPNLTDTIIVASLQPSVNTVAMLSIPRDLLVSVPKYGWKKINSVNAYGEMEAIGSGGEAVRTTAEGLLGIDIPYYVRIDFNGFKSIVDAVGGIDVFVEKNFVDQNYPTYNHEVQTISFDAGWQQMNGERALEYVRSRHGNNGEGSDFARSKRQQQVLSALKDKLISFKTFRSPTTVSNTLSALQSNITTNLNIGEILRLASMAHNIQRENIKYKVLTNSQNSPLVDKMINGAYVLLPKDNDWTLLRNAAVDLFSTAETASPRELTPPAEQTAVNTAIELRNGSGLSGLARETASDLSKMGFRIIKIGNADSFEYERTTIFDLTYGKNQMALDQLKQKFSGALIKKAESAEVLTPLSGADFLIILGSK